MSNLNDKEDKTGWIIGGGTMIGIGVGFMFLRENPLYFVGCIMIGIGAGLMIETIVSKIGKSKHDD